MTPLQAGLLAAAAASAMTARAEIINLTQGTNLAVAYDPGSAMLATDLLGGLWQLPSSGGGATALIPPGSGVAQPRFDPHGTRIVFQRMVDDQWDLWLLDLVTGQWSALTDTQYNEIEPDFAADGERVIFASNRSGQYALWEINIGNGGLRQLTDDPGDSHFPTAAVGTDIIYVNHYQGRSSLRRYAGRLMGVEMLRSEAILGAPSVRPGGSVVVVNERNASESSELKLFVDADEPIYRALTADEDVFVGRIAWLSAATYLYAADGALWKREIGATERSAVHLFAAANLPRSIPAAIVGALDEPGPHPVRGFRDYTPSPDGSRAAVSALGDLWTVDQDSAQQLTDDAFVDIQPQFVPDGNSLVFVSDRDGTMDLWQLRLDGGTAQQLTNEAGNVFSPVLSPDGKFVTFLVSAGPHPGAETELRLLQLDRPYRSEIVRDRLFDASELSWNTGELRLFAREGARDAALSEVVLPVDRGSSVSLTAGTGTQMATTRYEPDLSFSLPDIGAPYAVQVGRLFDGIRNDYARNMDIHVEGQRIREVVPRGQLPLPDNVVDARSKTVVPGFVDVHAHHAAFAGERLGRMWLGYGITTVREVDANLAAAIERAESWASGRRLGPRLVITPNRAAADAELPSRAPIIVQSATHISTGFAHAVASRPPVSPQAPISLSPLNRSYQDVIENILATGTFVSTGLAALDTPVEQRAWQDATNARQSLPAFAGTLERIAQSSGRIAIGSDAPAVPYGLGLHLELELLSRQGIPNAQILRWATAGGALALGLAHELGTLEAGKLADFVIIDGDPLDEIRDSQRIDAVVKGGIWLERKNLLRGLVF